MGDQCGGRGAGGGGGGGDGVGGGGKGSISTKLKRKPKKQGLTTSQRSPNQTLSKYRLIASLTLGTVEAQV